MYQVKKSILLNVTYMHKRITKDLLITNNKGSRHSIYVWRYTFPRYMLSILFVLFFSLNQLFTPGFTCLEAHFRSMLFASNKAFAMILYSASRTVGSNLQLTFSMQKSTLFYRTMDRKPVKVHSKNFFFINDNYLNLM